MKREQNYVKIKIRKARKEEQLDFLRGFWKYVRRNRLESQQLIIKIN